MNEAQSAFGWSPDGNYLAYLDGGRYLRVVRRDRTGVAGGKRVDTGEEVLDFAWARSPDVGSEPVLLGLTRRGVFVANILGGDIRVQALELTLSSPPFAPGSIATAPSPRIATCAVTAAEIVVVDRDRSLGPIVLSCRSDSDWLVAGATSLYADAAIQREVESRLLRQAGKKSGNVTFERDRALVVEVTYDRIVYDPASQGRRVEGMRVRGVRPDLSPDNVSRLSNLGPAVILMPPEEWERRSRIDVSSQGRYATLFDEKSQVAYVYGLAPFREVDRIAGVSDIKFAPHGPFLALRCSSGVYVAPDPATASRLEYLVAGSDPGTGFEWSPSGNELIRWDSAGYSVKAVYINQVLYGCEGPPKETAARYPTGVYERCSLAPDGTMVALQRRERASGSPEDTTGVYALIRGRVYTPSPETAQLFRLPFEDRVSLVGWLWYRD